MKIIDILNKKANGELEDGFKFIFGDTYTYNKDTDSIRDKEGIAIGNIYCIENILDCEIEEIEENKEILQLINPDKWKANDKDIVNIVRTINELVQAVNKLTKEREEK